MQRKITARIGNNVRVKWSIMRNGLPERLEGKNLSVKLYDKFRHECPIEWTTEENNIIITFWGKDQKEIGGYSVYLIEDEGTERQGVIDKMDAFILSKNSANANNTGSHVNSIYKDGDDTLANHADIVIDGLTSDFFVSSDGLDGKDGKDAYEMAVENGFTGSRDEWLNAITASPQQMKEIVDAKQDKIEYYWEDTSTQMVKLQNETNVLTLTADGKLLHNSNELATKKWVEESYEPKITNLPIHSDDDKDNLYWNGNVAEDKSFALGEDTKALSEYCITSGLKTKTLGKYSFAHGYYTETTNDYEFAVGYQNKPSDGLIFSVGCGVGARPKNAIQTKLDGNTWINGVGGFDGTNANSQNSLGVWSKGVDDDLDHLKTTIRDNEYVVAEALNRLGEDDNSLKIATAIVYLDEKVKDVSTIDKVAREYYRDTEDFISEYKGYFEETKRDINASINAVEQSYQEALDDASEALKEAKTLNASCGERMDKIEANLTPLFEWAKRAGILK